MKSLILFFVLTVGISNQNAMATSSEDLCDGAYLRDYSKMRAALKQGVAPDQFCKAHTSGFSNEVAPTPFVILAANLIRKVDSRVSDLPSVPSESTRAMMIDLIKFGAEPNTSMSMSKSYRFTNFNEALALLGNDEVEVINMYFQKNPDIHLRSNLGGITRNVCAESPIGSVLGNPHLSGQYKLAIVEKLVSLGANECDQ